MGWATKWLRSLLGAGKKKDKGKAGYGGSPPKERKRWSFGKPRQSSSSPGESRGDHSPASSALELAWLRTFCDDAEEGSKDALAVAVATAAAADAAVTAAHVAVARLKSAACGGSSCEWRAAVRIQTAFRCHLAKKALRALRGLVKLQALVRGFLVRKQAAVMFRRLQALARAQSAARTRLLPHQSHRRSFERYKDRDVDSKHLAAEQSVDCEMNPKIAEMVNLKHKSKSFRGTSSSYEDYYLQYCRRNPDKSPCSKTTPNTPRLRLETPAKSPSSCPSYMAKTTSFVAKARTQSAPKQRLEKTIPRKKVVASEEAEPRIAVMNSGGGLRRWPLRREGMVGKLERATGVARETAMDYYCSGGGDW